KAKESGRRISCVNNLKQLTLSLTMYADDNRGYFPERTDGGTPAQPNPRWTGRLRDGYRNLNVLRCPTDGPDAPTSHPSADPADSTSRTYIINGWNDYFTQPGTPLPMNSILGKTINENVIRFPSETIHFGEKKNKSGHFYMDLEEGNGNDYEELNQTMHSSGKGSNHSFVDGSVRFIKNPDTLGSKLAGKPNLWGITDWGRVHWASQ
ncbi:MAG: DUF1559 domain-containing protein, partial [Limisphaerales bacterium]